MLSVSLLWFIVQTTNDSFCEATAVFMISNIRARNIHCSELFIRRFSFNNRVFICELSEKSMNIVMETIELIWNRPESSEFPKVWCTFKASDIDGDRIVEYRIKDLPESRFDDGINFMAQHFCLNEPIAEALGR